MRVALVVTALLLSATCFSQSGYSIKFKVDGLKDTTAYLGYYFWESPYLKDTARVNSKGEFTFTGKQPLPQGVYMLILDKTRLVDFVVGENQNFSLETNTSDYYQHMQVKNDEDNKLYFDNIRNNVARHAEADPFVKILRDSTLAEDQKKDARESFSKVNEKVIAFHTALIQAHPKTMTARMLKATQAVKVPDAPKLANGKTDSTFQLRWYRDHFFDNIDLSDEAMIRLSTPVFKEKLNEYIDKLYAPNPDTVFNAFRKVVNKAKKNQETYKYAVWLGIQKFQQPEIMGLDQVFVDIYDTYFATGQMDYWANASIKKNLKDYADRLRKSLVGRTGANLIMQDVNLQPRDMYAIKAKYTILFIYDPECGHCRKETPKLVDFYNKNKKRFDVEVYAVSADTSMQKMKDFIKEFKTAGWINVNGPRTYVGSHHDFYDAVTTPSIYILDNTDKKKIIAKKIPIEKMEEFFINYEKFRKKDVTPKTPVKATAPSKAPATTPSKLSGKS